MIDTTLAILIVFGIFALVAGARIFELEMRLRRVERWKDALVHLPGTPIRPPKDGGDA